MLPQECPPRSPEVQAGPSHAHAPQPPSFLPPNPAQVPPATTQAPGHHSQRGSPCSPPGPETRLLGLHSPRLPFLCRHPGEDEGLHPASLPRSCDACCLTCHPEAQHPLLAPKACRLWAPAPAPFPGAPETAPKQASQPQSPWFQPCGLLNVPQPTTGRPSPQARVLTQPRPRSRLWARCGGGRGMPCVTNNGPGVTEG